MSDFRALPRATGLMVLIGACLFAQTTPAHATLSKTDEDWKTFRQANPFHIQTIAVSDPGADGTRTIIVSEPPPHVTRASLQLVSPELLRQVVVKQHRVGFDGWVKDVVISTPPITDRTLVQLTAKVSEHLFGTAYKVYTVPIRVSAGGPRRFPTNLRVPAGDLTQWLVQKREQFRTIFDDGLYTITELLQDSRTGVFTSKTPGLVVWIVPRKLDLSAYRREARQFALDSDIVIGGIGGETKVAIIARERVVPVSVLPPLRAETIMLLAAVDADSLSQSYERTNLFAGRTELRDLDWAPIYLSDALIDTEYGSLLNITDQLLKSWTESGRVKYYAFNYPAQQKYAFAKPLDQLLGTNRLTYNWNTKGAGYTVRTGGLNVLAVNRTGALPVSYIPEGSSPEQLKLVSAQEDRAYEWFADTNDPNLARVVQYAALYQIFREFGVTARGMSVPRYSHPESRAMGEEAARILKSFLATSDAERDGMLAELKLTTNETEEVKAHFARCQSLLRQYKKRSEDQEFRLLGSYMANPRIDDTRLRTLMDKPESQRTKSDLSLIAALITSRELQSGLGGDVFREMWVHPTESFKLYVNASKREPNTWVKTPSVVLSSFQGRIDIIGGHNLDAAPGRFVASAKVPKGKIEIRETPKGRVFLVNEADVGSVPNVLRRAAVSRDSPTVLARELEQQMAKARPSMLPRSEVLRLREGLTNAYTDSASGRGLASDHLGAGSTRSGFWPAPSKTFGPNPAAELSREGRLSIQIARNDDMTYSVRLPHTDGEHIADTYEGAMDVVVGTIRSGNPPGGRWSLHFVGLEESEMSNFIRTAEIQTGGPSGKVNLAGFGRIEREFDSQFVTSLKQRYDVRRAKIVDVSVNEPASTTTHRAVDVTVDFPAYTAARPSLLMRVRLFFARTIPVRVQELATSVVNRVLTRQSVQQASTTGGARARALTGEDIAGAIRADLESLREPALKGISIQVDTTGGRKVYIVQLRRTQAG